MPCPFFIVVIRVIGGISVISFSLKRGDGGGKTGGWWWQYVGMVVAICGDGGDTPQRKGLKFSDLQGVKNPISFCLCL